LVKCHEEHVRICKNASVPKQLRSKFEGGCCINIGLLVKCQEKVSNKKRSSISGHTSRNYYALVHSCINRLNFGSPIMPQMPQYNVIHILSRGILCMK
jgi:hypothetical protein